MKPLESSSSGPNEREGGREGERVRECQNENRERTGEAYVQTTNASCCIFCHCWGEVVALHTCLLQCSDKAFTTETMSCLEMSLECARKRRSVLSSAKEMTHALVLFPLPFVQSKRQVSHARLFSHPPHILCCLEHVTGACRPFHNSFVPLLLVEGFEAATAHFFAHAFESLSEKIVGLGCPIRISL